MFSTIRKLSKCQDRGATAVEYALMASLIAVVIAATVAIIGTQVNGLFASAQAIFG